MSTFRKLVVVAAAALGAAQAQNRLSTRSLLHITLPEDAPLSVLAADWGESVATPRGSAMQLDLRTSLTLRNSGNKRIRGVTLLVTAQEVAPGGKASVSVPSINVAPGESFPVRLNLRLLRPADNGDGPLAEVSLDGVLFEDLAFYGPNRLNSRRAMTQWEMEARRDRRFLKALYDRAGAEGVRLHMKDTVARLAERPKLDVQLARGRATAAEPERRLQFAFLRTPNAPVRPVRGWANVTGSEVRAPIIELESVDREPVRYVEIGWILTDEAGNDIYAGSVPGDVNLGPNQRARIQQQEATLKITQRSGPPAPIASMTGFVSHVEFSSGRLWIPDRDSLDAQKPRLLQPSAEEQRLANLYSRKGISAVVDEINRF